MRRGPTWAPAAGPAAGPRLRPSRPRPGHSRPAGARTKPSCPTRLPGPKRRPSTLVHRRRRRPGAKPGAGSPRRLALGRAGASRPSRNSGGWPP
eukprot:1688122-Alexandrium_andersonii.AAC.1